MSEPRRIVASLELAGLDGGELVVTAVRAHEEVSRAFHYVVDLTAEEIMVEELRGTEASVTLTDWLGQTRHLSGIVDRVEVMASEERHSHYRIHLVPRAYLLSYRRGSRIHQGLNVLDIVKKVFADAGIPAAYLKPQLSGTYAKRDFCVQYRETEWDFVCRLLEEEGIWFTFEQAADGHAMLLCDDSTKADPAEPQSLDHVTDPGLHGDTVRCWGFTSSARMVVKKTGTDGYDLEAPTADRWGEQSGKDGSGEWVQHSRPFPEASVMRRLAQARLDELRGPRAGARLETNALPVLPGRKVELTQAPEGPWFVKSLTLEVELQDQVDQDALERELPSMLAHLELELFPGDSTFRPARRTPRPVIAGVQTARVVGPKGEEIHCDKYGRVKLRFHWDSEHPADDTASYWIRVAQPQTTGAVLIPRTGWEVLVEFLNGDPDQPICKGRVFNPLTPPPFELPENKTVMAHRSYSSPGGGGVNEMRFEDAAGKQEVTFGAHRDFNITAAHDKSRDVKNADTHVVNGDRTLTIGTKGAGVETVTITGGDTTRIGGNAKIEVGSRKVTVAHDASEHVKGNLDIHVSADDSALVGNPLAAVLKAVAVHAVEAVGEKAQDKLLGKLGVKESFQKLKSGVENAATMGGVLAKGYLAPLSKQVGDTAKALADDVKNFSKMTIGTEAAVIASDKLGVGVDPGLPGAAKIVPVNAPSASAAPPKGEGTWKMIVHGDLKEEIKGRALLVAADGMSYKVGGKSTEQVMAARMLAVANGGAKEMTAKSNNEIVGGLTMIQVKKSITRQAGAAMATTAVVSQKIEVKKSYAIASKRKAMLASRKIEFDAGDSIVLKCGLSEVVIDSSGVTIKGLDVKIEASGKFKLSEAAITPNPT